MRYTIANLQKDYSSDAACLEHLFKDRFGAIRFCPYCGASTKFYRVKKRQSYACQHCGYQLFPMAGTIFNKSRTPLSLWFFAIYLFSVGKNGVAAKELERQLGVTYKTAWRMAHQIRKLMRQDNKLLNGIVEADEAYIGGRRRSSSKREKIPVLGVVERKGRAKVVVTHVASAITVTDFLNQSIEPETILNTDESPLYIRSQKTYKRQAVAHARWEFVRDETHTNTIEGFWGQLKRSFHGTYHWISKKYMQAYVDEFVFRYNYREEVIFGVILGRIGAKVA